jgi:plasmid stability protein
VQASYQDLARLKTGQTEPRPSRSMPGGAASIDSDREVTVADLLVRGVDDTVVRALKKRAGEHGRSAEAEHRTILAAALLNPPRRSLAELLASMPEVGRVEDFARQQEAGGGGDVFG